MILVSILIGLNWASRLLAYSQPVPFWAKVDWRNRRAFAHWPDSDHQVSLNAAPERSRQLNLPSQEWPQKASEVEPQLKENSNEACSKIANLNHRLRLG